MRPRPTAPAELTTIAACDVESGQADGCGLLVAEEKSGSAQEALLRLQDIGRRLFERNPVLLRLGSTRVGADTALARHEPVTARLTRLIEKGKASGEFAPAAPVTRLVAAVTVLGHAAGDEVRADRMPVEEAATWLRAAALALLSIRPRNSASWAASSAQDEKGL